MNRYLPLIVFGVLLNAGAQIAIKQGMKSIGYFDFKLENFIRILLAVSVNPFILMGITAYVVSLGVWMMVLSRVEVTYAYPLLSIGYVVTAVAGWQLFDEAMGPMRWAGVIVICCGVWLITRTA